MQYLASEHAKAGGSDMVRPDLPIPDEMPPCLYELTMVERWASLGIPPFSGGWQEYPAYYLLDLDAAMAGRDRFRYLCQLNADRRDQWQTGGNRSAI
jgi:hypothetical protein